MTKNERQQQGINKYLASKLSNDDNRCLGGFHYPTGFGKTTTAIKIIKLKELNIKTAIVVVPTTALEKQWKDIVYNSELSETVHVHTVQYYVANDLKPQCDILIVDELHKYYRSGSENPFIDYINGKKIKFNHYLWLSATPFDRHNRHIEITEFAPIVDSIDEEEALSNGWISNYYTFNLGIDLPDDKIERYNEIADTIYKETGKFMKKEDRSYENAFKLMTRCISGGKDDRGIEYTAFQWASALARHNGWTADSFRENPEAEELWNPGKIIGYAKNCMGKIRERKEMLWNDQTKIKTVIDILKKFDDKSAISFSESIEFANRVYHEAKRSNIKAGIYHSQIESGPLVDPNTGKFYLYASGKKKGQPKVFSANKIKEYSLECLKCEIIQYLSTAKSLDEGFDSPNVRLGISTSFSSNPNQYVQRTGRIKRLFNNRSAIIVNVFFKNTKEEEWLKTAIEGSNRDKIYWVNEIDEISEDIENTYYI